jgi:hypothetical protein
MTIQQIMAILHGEFGGNRLFFQDNINMIGEFIRENGIQQVDVGQMATEAKTSVKTFIDLGIRGGIRTPHLHFNDKIYMLTKEQWTKLSAKIITDCKTKLSAVKEIGFEEGLLLEDMIQSLTKN